MPDAAPHLRRGCPITPKDSFTQIRTLLTGINKGVLQATPTAELVRLGSDLWGVANLVKGLLEDIKDHLRSRVPLSPGQHQLGGPGTICLVTIQEPQPVLRKEVSVPDLRASLGADFGVLFEVTEIVTPRGDFKMALQRVEDPERVRAVLDAVDLVVHKPRMSFQPNGNRS